MAARLASLFSRARITKLAFYSSSTISLGAVGFYRYHSTQPTASVLASNTESHQQQTAMATEGPAAAHRVYSRMTIPSGGASAIECPPDVQDVRHVLVTVQGEGEVVFHGDNADANSTVMFGDVGANSMMRKPLRLGGSVGVPCSKYNEIVNSHATKDLVLVITSVPNSNF